MFILNFETAMSKILIFIVIIDEILSKIVNKLGSVPCHVLLSLKIRSRYNKTNRWYNAFFTLAC